MPFVERQLDGRTLRILIDTGAAKNYVRPVKELKNVTTVDAPFTVNSIHGSSKIKQKCSMKIFGKVAPFFILDTLDTFDAIIGFDLLTQAGVTLNLLGNNITYGNKSEMLKHHLCDNVNFTRVDDIIVPDIVRGEFKKMILKRIKAFSTSNEALPFNTSVIATIRTEDNEPV